MTKKKFNKGDRKLYENVFDGLSYYPTVGETYHLSRAKSKVQKYFLESISEILSPRILDIGCFIGTDLFMLPKVNTQAKYWGVDLSADAISYAQKLSRQRGEKNITFKRVDANKPFPFANEYFDTILALELIEHLQKPDKFLKDVYRLLKPGGTLIVTTPNEDNMQNIVLRLLPEFIKSSFKKNREKDFLHHGPEYHINSDDWDHEAHISLKGFNSWVNEFRKVGFSVESVDGSAAYAGSRFIGDHPLLLGITIIIDSLIDKLPLKPHLQMCMIIKLKK